MDADFKMEDITLRHTSKEGDSYVRTHRVWNKMLFLESQQAAVEKDGGKAKIEVVDQKEAQP